MSICRVELPSFTVEKERKKKTGSSCGFVLDPVYDCENCLERKKKRGGGLAQKEELERTNHFLFPFYGSSRFLFSSAAESLLRREIQTEREREGGGRGTSPFFRLSELVGGWWRKKKQRAGSVSSTPV